MAAQKINLVASATDASPRTTPGGVPQNKLVHLGERIPGTDEQPCSLWLTLEGTAANTAVVTVWWTPDDPNAVVEASRKWYSVKTAITITVGEVVRAPAVPGLCCLQVTTAPAADAVLIVKVSSQPYATPVS